MSNLVSRSLLVGYLVLSAGASSAQQTGDCASALAPPTRARILEVEAVGEDLRVSVSWNNDPSLPGAAKVRVRDDEGDLLAQKTVTPEPGLVTIELIAEVLDVLSHGFQYEVDIKNILGEPYPFRADLVCVSPADCGYVLTGGVFSDALVLDFDLADALSVIASSVDVLTDLLAAEPELEGQVVSLALQLAELDERIGIPIGACSCAWSAAVRWSPEKIQWLYPENMPIEEGAITGPGAAHYLGAQSLDGAIGRAEQGSSRLAAALRCGVLQDWGTYPFTLPGSSSGPLPIPWPLLATCSSPCAGEVTHEAVFESRLEVMAIGGTLSTSSASAQELVQYSIDGVTVLDELTEVTVFTPLEGDTTDADCVYKTSIRQLTEPSETLLLTAGEVSVDAGLTAYAFAELGNRHQMEAMAFASCALDPEVTVRLKNTISAAGEEPIGRGGLHLEPWCR